MELSEQEQYRRGVAFAELHAGRGTFVIPNPWDAGSARLLAALGFRALATTSAGLAFALGRPDGVGAVSREETLANARAIVAATPLPVSADLENAFADTPEEVAATIRLAAEAGLVGASIEDFSGRPDDPIMPLDVAVDRVTAAVEAARALPFPFTVTARTENFGRGRPDLDDTIRRLLAFEKAGADVLYAPWLPGLDAIRTVCATVSRPVNVVAERTHTVAELAACGVRRISVGSAFARTALAAAVRAATEVRDAGTFTFLADALPIADIDAAFA
jgi:2-methylisocitrate lyase-like PEP mutase family enzyme